MRKVLVSVILNTYNNEKTIQKCLDSILAQETDFDFEVLVHDDASTDKTADIIELYTKKYREIIKPIYQTENQKAKGIDINKEYQYTRAVGKYIAIAEPDGYWTYNKKLQTQLDFLEHHPDIPMCAHSSIMIEEGRAKKLVVSKKNCVLTFERILSTKDAFVPLNSIMYKLNPSEEERAFCEKYPFIYSGVVTAAINGGVLYISKPMSVSIKKSVENIKSDEEKIMVYEKLYDMLAEADSMTNSEYSGLINIHKNEQKFNVLRIQENYKEMKLKKYKASFKKLPLKEKFKIRFSK